MYIVRDAWLTCNPYNHGIQPCGHRYAAFRRRQIRAHIMASLAAAFMKLQLFSYQKNDLAQLEFRIDAQFLFYQESI